jgi:ketosteroid isomerase-like protein
MRVSKANNHRRRGRLSGTGPWQLPSAETPDRRLGQLPSCSGAEAWGQRHTNLRDVDRPTGATGVIRRTLHAGAAMTADRSKAETNMELMQTLDDAWNAQDLETFSKRHKPDVVVMWPGKPPTHGVKDHEQEAVDFFRAFPDQHLVNRPYRVFFASGDFTCSIARFTGTMTGPMRGADGKDIPPTGKSFEVDFCTVARWDNGQIVEENLFYDLVTFMQQIGLSQ